MSYYNDYVTTTPEFLGDLAKMDLIEREQFLDELRRLWRRAGSAHGATALVTGEAGIGKTALIEQFTQERGAGTRILYGICDALFTPRPLGPLHDIALQLKGDLLHALENGADRLLIFSLFLQELQNDSPILVVFEDIHWADEATLDLIKFIGRRIASTRALLIFSFRDDEVGRNHPVRIALGDLPSATVTRIALPRLSQAAVVELARPKQVSSEWLYSVTGGNPFFVTEVLASDEQGVPPSVADAVLARAAHLSPQARELLEVVSCVPGGSERWLLKAVLPYATDALDECIDKGMLRSGPRSVVFRHELARLAVEDALPAGRYRALHARILQALQESDPYPVEVTRIVHHATGAGDGESVLKFAPIAAKRAASVGAHQEAASHYAAALRFAMAAPPAEQALLLEARSYECYLTDQLETAFEAQKAALAIWRQLDQTVKEGNSYRWLSRLSWFMGRKSEAEAYGAKALEILEPLLLCREKAMAYSNMAQLHMLADQTEEAVHWGEQAIHLAESLGDQETLTHALNNVGSAWFIANDVERGEPLLSRSLRLALENSFEEHAARAYTNLATSSVRNRRFEQADRYLNEGIAYCTERDLDSWAFYMKAWLAHLYLERGEWLAAAGTAQSVLKTPRLSAITRIPALAALGWVRVRSGDPGAMPVLGEAKELALATKELQRIAPVAAARAEAVWLQGNRAQCREEVQPAYALARQHGDAWSLGLLAFWLWRAGSLGEAPQGAAKPFASQMAGDWRGAARQWESIGCPYERAMALADGDSEAQLQALQILRKLGANPAAEVVERQLRAQGVRGIPRGPRHSTRENPAGLTDREMEVMPLLAAGLTNKEIAGRLHISPKTVEHHISSILSKLGVRSRTEAAHAALNLGILSTE